MSRPTFQLVPTPLDNGKCDCPRCLSVCLSVSKITQKHVHMDLDEMLHVSRCRDMDELINF